MPENAKNERAAMAMKWDAVSNQCLVGNALSRRRANSSTAGKAKLRPRVSAGK
jgi:hypothetical protein